MGPHFDSLQCQKVRTQLGPITLPTAIGPLPILDQNPISFASLAMVMAGFRKALQESHSDR